MKSEGLGDTIEKITKATGLKSLIGECGGCDNRKTLLNTRYPYGSHVTKKSKGEG